LYKERYNDARAWLCSLAS